MKKIKIAHVGLLLGALFFVAGTVFAAEGPKIALLVGGILLLVYSPLYSYFQKMQALQAKDPEPQPGLKEYGTILVIVAILVSVTYHYTDGFLKNSISEYVGGPSF